MIQKGNNRRSQGDDDDDDKEGEGKEDSNRARGVGRPIANSCR
jgi:hypothetical protein